jgi:beta-lactamase superfamily II metal-dependent hydrolase
VSSPIQPGDLVIHILNVGHGDAILVEFPEGADHKRERGIVDCYKGSKMLAYLKKLDAVRPEKSMAFVCATHPHRDHILGVNKLLNERSPGEFWDSGFRHNTSTYKTILTTIAGGGIRMLRVSSGMEWYFGSARVTVVAPSIMLRNRYATYGVDMNNASIVLRLENCRQDVVTTESQRYEGTVDPEWERSAGRSVVVLGGDAEFDSWARASQEFPCLERTSTHDPLVKKMINLLNCQVLKVSHHGSMHSAPLDIYERMSPSLAVVSNKQKTQPRAIDGQDRGLFPHMTTALALEEVGAEVLTTDGSYGGASPTSVVVVVPPGGIARWARLDDTDSQVPEPPTEV